MAHPRLSAALLALVSAVTGCDSRGADASQASVTVKLPPARPRTPEPAFSFKAAPAKPQPTAEPTV